LKVSYHIITILSEHTDHRWKQKHYMSKYTASYSSILFYGFVPHSLTFQNYTEDRKLPDIQIKSIFHYS